MSDAKTTSWSMPFGYEKKNFFQLVLSNKAHYPPFISKTTQDERRIQMLKLTTLVTAVALAASVGAVHAGNSTAKPSELTEAQVTDLKTAWGEGIVKIGAIFTEGGDYRAAAKDHIKTFYAYGQETVLFKPTLASADQFRGTMDEALSYFVGGSIKEDKGFAIAPYTNVRWENEGTVINGETALTMGNYFFKKPDGSEVKVEYTFGIELMENGTPKIVLHHSSLPFAPTS
ncbi:MAG: phosphoribosyl-AMP cyclohydrolase [Pseudomonadota bacterium]